MSIRSYRTHRLSHNETFQSFLLHWFICIQIDPQTICSKVLLNLRYQYIIVVIIRALTKLYGWLSYVWLDHLLVKTWNGSRNKSRSVNPLALFWKKLTREMPNQIILICDFLYWFILTQPSCSIRCISGTDEHGRQMAFSLLLPWYVTQHQWLFLLSRAESIQ